MKKKRLIKKIIKLILLLMIFSLSYSFFFTLYENIKVNKMITDFKSRASDKPELIIDVNYRYSNFQRRFYSVPRETSDEKDGKNVFEDDEKKILGRKNDIFVTQQSPFPTVPIFHQFMSFYYGGHAAIKYESSSFFESTGYPGYGESVLDIIFSNGDKDHGYTPTVALNKYNYWYDPTNDGYYYDLFYRSKFVGLRPVNPFSNPEDFDKYLDLAIDSALLKVENNALYNFLFFLNMKKKYYCTDLVSRVYEEAYEKVLNDLSYKSNGYAKRMNDDGFITSVNDLILSKETYIHFYVEIEEEMINGNKKVIQNIYYLEDIQNSN